MCEEESDDTEAVEKLKTINDSIRRTIERYKLVKKGDLEGASKIPKGTLGTTTGVSKNANNELSLIDFDPEPSPNGGAQGTTSSLENDLLGLSFQDKPAATSAAPAAPAAPAASGTPLPGRAPAGTNYDILSSLTSSQPGSQSATPTPSVSQPSRQTTSPPIDPFASLVSASPRAVSPAAPVPATQQPSQPSSSSLLDLAGDASSSAPGQTEANNSGGDEEWTFTSALPEGTLPSTNKVRVLNSSLVIDFAARRNPGHDRQIHVVALFSNSTSRLLTELHFQVAVERVCRLHICYLFIFSCNLRDSAN